MVFRDLFRTQNVTQTASNLALSQPAISHALNRLRDSLGDELFIRSGKKLVPTQRAIALGEQISTQLTAIENTVFHQQKWDAKTAQKSFTLSGTSYDATVWFPQLMGQFKKIAPNIQMTFRGIVIEEYLERMINGQVDLSFAGNLSAMKNFSVETLSVCDTCIIANKKSKKYGDKISFREYLSAEHILYTPTEKPGSEVDSFLAKKGKQRNICVHTSYLNSIPELITKRDYLSIVPRFYAQAIKNTYPIKLLEPPFKVEPFRHQMVWHKSKDQSPDHKWLRDHMRSNYPKYMGLPL